MAITALSKQLWWHRSRRPGVFWESRVGERRQRRYFLGISGFCLPLPRAAFIENERADRTASEKGVSGQWRAGVVQLPGFSSVGRPAKMKVGTIPL